VRFDILEAVPRCLRTRWPLKRFYWQKEDIERIEKKVREFQLLCEPLLCAHDLYKTEDGDAPESIKDRNGEVVLALCKKCGRTESQL